MNNNEINNISKKLEIETVLYNNICSVVPFKRLRKDAKRLLSANSDYIRNINDKSIRAIKYGEELSIDVNLDENTYKLYTTEWGKTDIHRIFVKKYDNGCTFFRHTNDIKYQGDSGYRRIVYNFLFDREECLIYASHAEIVDMDYYVKKEHKTSYRCETTQIFVEKDTKRAYIKNVKNGEVEHFMIDNIPNFKMNDDFSFGSLSERSKKTIDENTYLDHEFSNKIKTLRK